MVNDVNPRSGSRWEPTPAATDPWPDDQATVAVAEAPPPQPGDTAGPAATPDAPRRPRARLVTATVAGAALLLLGGAGGYAIGQATAGDSGTAGTSGTFGPGQGGPGGRGGGFGGQFGGGPGNGAGGVTPGTGSGGTTPGSGTGGTSSGTGGGSGGTTAGTGTGST